MLPQMDGWRVTEELRREDPRVPVIVCSARTSEFDRVHGLEMGADDYVTKPFSMKELLARVNAHLRRVESHRQPDGAQSIEAGGARDRPRAGAGLRRRPRRWASPRASSRCSTPWPAPRASRCPRERVYREVWGYEMMRGDRSVDVFVRKVRQKLAAARPDRSYVQTHYGVGYRFEPPSRGRARRRRPPRRAARAPGRPGRRATLPGLGPRGDARAAKGSGL